MRSLFTLVRFAVMMGISVPIVAAEINPTPTAMMPTTAVVAAIRGCSTPAPPQPTLIADAMKAANKWQRKLAAERIGKLAAKVADKSELEAILRSEDLRPTDIVLVGNFARFYTCVGAANATIAAEVARNMRYVVHHKSAPALLNYEYELIGLIADYEAGKESRWIRTVVAGWMVSAKAITSGAKESEALQREHMFLRASGIGHSDPNLKILRRRIAEAAAREIMGQSLEVPLLPAKAPTQIAAR